jgi:hypothetical protein
MKQIKRALGNIGLFILSQLLGIVMIPLGITWAVVKAFWKRRWRTGIEVLGDKFITLAESFDKYGGVVCKEFLNDTMIKKESPYKFGDIHETISKDYGLNEREGYLTGFGKFWVKVLNKLDRNHTKKAAEGKSKL